MSTVVTDSERSDAVARRVAEVDALRRRVLNVIPHALRTPVTTFGGLARSLSDASEQQIREEIAPALQRLSTQAERLLDDMLIAAGLSTAMPAGPAVALRVLATARQAYAGLGGGELKVEGSEEATARMPAGSLEKVFVHLLDNAMKYGDGDVVVAATTSGDVTRVEVRSGGPGLAEVERRLAFEPFWRAEAAVMAGPGLGVGLTVARALAEQAGGRLGLEPGPAGVVAVLELAA